MGTINLTKEHNIVKSISDNVERVKNNNIEVWYATKTLGFNESSIDKPNFYNPRNITADKNKETVIDEQILNWENNISLLYTYPSQRDGLISRIKSYAWKKKENTYRGK